MKVNKGKIDEIMEEIEQSLATVTDADRHTRDCHPMSGRGYLSL